MPILSVERRITAGFTLAALVVATLGAISYTSSKRAAAAASMERRSHQVEARLNGVLRDIADAESAALAYVITGDESALALLPASERKIEDEIRELRELIVTVEQRRRLALLPGVVRARMDALRRLVVTRRTAGFGAAYQQFTAGDESGVALHTLIATMQERGRVVQDVRQQRARTWQQRTEIIVVSVAIAAILFIGVALGLVLRQLGARSRSDSELRKVSEDLRKVIEFSRDTICAFDAEGRFVQCSPSCMRLLGYRPEELLGRRFMEMVVPEDRPRTEETAAAIMAGNATDSFENRCLRKDGSITHIMWSAQWSDVEQVMFCIARDVSEQQRLREEAIRRTQALERATGELAEARDRAVAADRVKSAFLATMSHELRTPLNSIIGFTGIILQGLAGPLNPEQTKQLEMVRGSARHLLSIINDVLDISKIEAGEMKVESQTFDLRSSIERVIGIVRPLAEKKGLALDVRLAPEIGAMEGDRRRVEQVLLNLMNNAIKFTERGKVMLQANGPTARPGVVRLDVSDTGIGIRPEEITSLFEPFRQIDSEISRAHEGTGLGLAICRRLAALMGGEVSAESEWGRGSTFTLTLPLKEPVPS